jgi:phage replication initiation protein
MIESSEAFIHWLSLTMPSEFELSRVFTDVLKIPNSSFALRKRGREGYRSQYSNDSQTIIVLTDGGHFGMGHHIVLTGSACEEIGPKIVNIALSAIELGGKISRVDLAIDDHVGLLDLAVIESSIRKGLCTSRFLTPPRIEGGFDKKTGKESGKWIKFGRRSSGMYFRFYDKAAEQRKPGHWVRLEVEAKGKNATEIMRQVAQGKTLGTMLFGLLRNYLAFREPSSDPNRSRWPYATWWSRFLGEVEKVQLGTGRAKEAEKRVDWFLKLDKTLARVVDLYGPEVLNVMIETGRLKNARKQTLPAHAA